MTRAPLAAPDRSTGGSARRSLGRWRGLLLSAAAGVVLAGSFESTPGALLAPVGLALFFAAVTAAARSGWRALQGYVFGATFLGIHLWWLAPSIGLYAWVAVSAALSAWYAAFAVLLGLSRHRRAWPAVAAGTWAVMEVGRSGWPLGGMPWGRLGVGTVDTPWAQYLPYVGVTGTSFVVALLGALLVVAARRWRRRQWRAGVAAALAAAVVAGAAATVPYATTRVGSTPEAGDPAGGAPDSVTVAVVQGEVPGDGTMVAANQRRITQTIADATVALAADVRAGLTSAPDVVVWPENSVGIDPSVDETAAAEVRRAAETLGVPLLLGAIVDGPREGTAFNRTLVWEGGQPAEARYTKAHPVPFGEYVPWRRWIGDLSSRFDEIPRDMLPGDSTEPLQVGDLRLAMAICFDIAYRQPLVAQVSAGADLIVVQTSNAMFTGTRQPRQQFMISRARALETGRTVVVSSLNGLSGLISPSGEVEAVLPARDSGIFVGSALTPDALTPSVRLGNTVELGLLGLVAMWNTTLLAGWLRGRAGRRRPSAC